MVSEANTLDEVVLTALGLSLYQQKLVINREPAQCLLAFLNNNWVGAVLFIRIAAHYGLA